MPFKIKFFTDAAQLYVLRCCSTLNLKKTLCFQSYIKKKMQKFQSYFALLLTKKNTKNTKKAKTNYAIHSNNVATLLAVLPVVLLLLQLFLQIKNKHKKLSSLGNLEFALSKAVNAAFFAAQTFSFTAAVISCLRFSRSIEVVA